MFEAGIIILHKINGMEENKTWAQILTPCLLQNSKKEQIGLKARQRKQDPKKIK